MKNLITKKDFDLVIKNIPKYYSLHRWNYHQIVLDILKEIEFKNALELGAYKLPFIKNSLLMDIIKHISNKEYIIHDAKKLPWPFKDKQFDMFIATQVWEHLGGKQKEIFLEMKRVSKKAILSFPYLWNTKSLHHNNINEKVISAWSSNILPKKIIFDKQKVSQRVVYYWEFDK